MNFPGRKQAVFRARFFRIEGTFSNLTLTQPVDLQHPRNGFAPAEVEQADSE
jgi:hypothetical protein